MPFFFLQGVTGGGGGGGVKTFDGSSKLPDYNKSIAKLTVSLKSLDGVRILMC